MKCQHHDLVTCELTEFIKSGIVLGGPNRVGGAFRRRTVRVMLSCWLQGRKQWPCCELLRRGAASGLPASRVQPQGTEFCQHLNDPGRAPELLVRTAVWPTPQLQVRTQSSGAWTPDPGKLGRRVCLTTSTPAHMQMCECLVEVLHGYLCCALSRGGEVPTQRSKVLVPPLRGQKPADAQLTVSQAHGQKGKGSKLTQCLWFFCGSRNLRQTSLVSEQAAV